MQLSNTRSFTFFSRILIFSSGLEEMKLQYFGGRGLKCYRDLVMSKYSLFEEIISILPSSDQYYLQIYSLGDVFPKILINNFLGKMLKLVYKVYKKKLEYCWEW